MVKPSYEHHKNLFPFCLRDIPETWYVNDDSPYDEHGGTTVRYYNFEGNRGLKLSVSKVNNEDYDGFTVDVSIVSSGYSKRVPKREFFVKSSDSNSNLESLARRAEYYTLGVMYDWRDGFETVK